MKIITALLLFSTITFAQVGIGTTTPDPTKMLDVNGDILITDTLETQLITDVNAIEDDFHLISRVNNSSPVGLVKVLKTDQLDVTPIRMQKYRFVNLDLDNLEDISLNLDKDDYVVSLAGFEYSGPGIAKNNDKIGPFKVNLTGNADGTWHLAIKNQSIDPLPTDDIEYEVTLFISQSDYFKNMPAVHVDLGGSNTGDATTDTPTIFK